MRSNSAVGQVAALTGQTAERHYFSQAYLRELLPTGLQQIQSKMIRNTEFRLITMKQAQKLTQVYQGLEESFKDGNKASVSQNQY